MSFLEAFSSVLAALKPCFGPMGGSCLVFSDKKLVLASTTTQFLESAQLKSPYSKCAFKAIESFHRRYGDGSLSTVLMLERGLAKVQDLPKPRVVQALDSILRFLPELFSTAFLPLCCSISPEMPLQTAFFTSLRTMFDSKSALSLSCVIAKWKPAAELALKFWPVLCLFGSHVSESTCTKRQLLVPVSCTTQPPPSEPAALVLVAGLCRAPTALATSADSVKELGCEMQAIVSRALLRLVKLYGRAVVLVGQALPEDVPSALPGVTVIGGLERGDLLLCAAATGIAIHGSLTDVVAAAARKVSTALRRYRTVSGSMGTFAELLFEEELQLNQLILRVPSPALLSVYEDGIRRCLKLSEATFAPAVPLDKPMRMCDCCGAILASCHRCSRCKRVFYCSQACQRRDWSAKHRSQCRKWSKSRPPPSRVVSPGAGLGELRFGMLCAALADLVDTTGSAPIVGKSVEALGLRILSAMALAVPQCLSDNSGGKLDQWRASMDRQRDWVRAVCEGKELEGGKACGAPLWRDDRLAVDLDSNPVAVGCVQPLGLSWGILNEAVALLKQFVRIDHVLPA